MGESHLGLGMPVPKDREELLKVQLLPGVGDVHDLLGVPGFEAIGKGGEIGGCIVRGAVALPDNGRVVFQRRVVIEEDHLGTVTLACQPESRQFIDNAGEACVVEAFAQGLVEAYSQPLIDGVKLMS